MNQNQTEQNFPTKFTYQVSLQSVPQFWYCYLQTNGHPDMTEQVHFNFFNKNKNSFSLTSEAIQM